jgi:2-oxoglutarate decarboxylase
VVRHDHVGSGPGRRREQGDGTRTLLVPVVRHAESLDFRAFVVAYEDLVRKVHTQKVTADDFAGATVTLTNPAPSAPCSRCPG